VLQRVVIEGEQVELGYVARDRAESTRIVHPLGLAAKGSVWYLVADTEAGLRTFRVDRVTAVEGTGNAVVRPDGFELGEAWRLIREEVDQLRSPIQVRLAAVPGIIGILRMVFDTKVRVGGARPDGRIDVEIAGAHIDALAGQIGGFGAAVEVLEPAALRDELARIGVELAELYAEAVGHTA